MEHDEIDTIQLAQQVSRVHAILECEARALGDSRRLVLGGNSQGGTVALHAAMAWGSPLGALLCSRTCFMDNVTTVSRDPAVQSTPIFVFAAADDDIYILPLVRRCFGLLEAAGYRVTWHVEKGLAHHDDSRNELRFAAKWISTSCLGLCRSLRGRNASEGPLTPRGRLSPHAGVRRVSVRCALPLPGAWLSRGCKVVMGGAKRCRSMVRRVPRDLARELFLSAPLPR